LSCHLTSSSTFAIRTKPTRKPKIAKEFALLAPRLDTFCHLERIENKTKNNKAQHIKAICNNGFNGNSSVLPRLNFGVGGQESSPQSLTTATLVR